MHLGIVKLCSDVHTHYLVSEQLTTNEGEMCSLALNRIVIELIPLLCWKHDYDDQRLQNVKDFVPRT